MAQIDPSIALGVKPIQIQDPLTVQSRAMEGAVNALKYQDLQRATQEEQEVRNYLRGANLADPNVRAGLSQFGKTGLGYGKLIAEQEKAGLETTKLKADINEKELKAFRERMSDLAFNTSPANITAHIQDAILRKQITPEQGAATLQQTLAMSPEQRKQYFLQLGVGADKRLEQMSLSEFQKQDLAVKREGQRLQYDPTTQAKLEGAKTKARKEAEQEIAGEIDVKANRKALATAGYDVATGKDDISDLIKKSTGSYIGKAVDIGGRTFGTSTEGSKALQTLVQKGNAITFGLLNGKLGAGISKSDAELVASLVGQLGDGTLPVEDRLAAWESAKNNMVRLGMIEAPANNVNVPGVGSQVKTPGSGTVAPAANRPSLDSIFAPGKK